jgi:hypothetical protein
MAKDRFSKYKPVNWNSGYKATGSFLKPDKPRKELKSTELITKLTSIVQTFSMYLTQWEVNFITNLLSHPYALSDKQNQVISNIKENVRKKMELEKIKS